MSRYLSGTGTGLTGTGQTALTAWPVSVIMSVEPTDITHAGKRLFSDQTVLNTNYIGLQQAGSVGAISGLGYLGATTVSEYTGNAGALVQDTWQNVLLRCDSALTHWSTPTEDPTPDTTSKGAFTTPTGQNLGILSNPTGTATWYGKVGRFVRYVGYYLSDTDVATSNAGTTDPLDIQIAYQTEAWDFSQASGTDLVDLRNSVSLTANNALYDASDNPSFGSSSGTTIVQLAGGGGLVGLSGLCGPGGLVG